MQILDLKIETANLKEDERFKDQLNQVGTLKDLIKEFFQRIEEIRKNILNQQSKLAKH